MPHNLITADACLRHQMTEDHAEQPDRIRSILAELDRTGTLKQLERLEANACLASETALKRVHSDDHVRNILRGHSGDTLRILDQDTAMNAHSLDAALACAAAVIQGADRVMAGQASHVFCCIRPPAHHAERERAMGFCLFNSVAVAAAHLLEVHGLERVAIVDFDVHHGNGTEQIFRADPRVMVCSSYQSPLYPFVDNASVAGRLINTPLPAGCDGESFRSAINRDWWPALDAFKPQCLLVSAGFDAHRDDPLAGLSLLESDYAWLARRIYQCSQTHCPGRVVSTLEGGYDLNALASSVTAYLQAWLQSDDQY